MSIKKGKFRVLDDGLLVFYCQGCKTHHWINTDASKSPHWNFNGNYYKPTITPSIHVTTPNKCCHSFVSDGKIQYLNDCYHELKGQTVELEDMEE